MSSWRAHALLGVEEGTRNWWMLQTSDILELVLLLLNLIIILRNHAESPFLSGNVGPTSAVITDKKYCGHH